MRKDIENRIIQIREWIKENRSKNWMCKELLCKPSTLDGYLKKFNIEYKGNRGAKGYKIGEKKESSFYTEGEKLITSSRLRKKLIEEGIKPHRCEICENDKWLDQKIPLDLHHIDGNRFNNSLDNLQILCKNCHALTPSYSIIYNFRK